MLSDFDIHENLLSIVNKVIQCVKTGVIVL